MEVLLALDLHCCVFCLSEKPLGIHWSLDSADTAPLHLCTNRDGFGTDRGEYLYQKRRQICANYRSGFCTIKKRLRSYSVTWFDYCSLVTEPRVRTCYAVGGVDSGLFFYTKF
jgi:hypothetical protein